MFFASSLTSKEQQTLLEDSIAEEIWIAQVVHRFFWNPVREVAKVFHHYLLDQIQVAYLERRNVSQENGGPEEPVLPHLVVLLPDDVREALSFQEELK